MVDRERAVILTLDVGSSGVRAQVFDCAGEAVGEAAAMDQVVLTTPDGGAVLDAALVAAACERTIDAALAALPPDAVVVAVASATLVPNVVGVDAEGRPITPILTWGDVRAAEDTRQLRTVLEPIAYHERTGCVLHASYVPAKLVWLRRTQPEVFGRVRRWLALGDYLFLRWFGQARCAHSVAAWSGLLNRHSLDWDGETLAALGIEPRQLGELADFEQGSVGLLPGFAARWPRLQGVPFLPTLGDGVGSTVGSDCLTPNRLALVVGTSGALRLMLPGTPVVLPAGLWVYRVDRKRSLLGGALSNGGNVFAWLRQTLRLPEPAALEAALATRPAAEHGLTMLPFLAGERSPGWADDATAAIMGMRWNTEPIDVAQAALEAVAYRFALIHRQLLPHVPAAHTLVASGGGLLNSPAWLQIMADVLGQPVISSDRPASTRRGMALLACEALGYAPLPLADLADRPVFEPRAAHYAAHQQALARHEALYAALIGERF